MKRDSQERVKSQYANGDVTAEGGLLLIGLLERLQNFICLSESYFGAKERVSAMGNEKKSQKA